MDIVKNLCTLIVFAVILVLAIPLIGAGLGLVALLALTFGAALIWLLPILLILNSDKTTGGEKLAWILAIIFLSWFAWIFYFLLAPLKPRQNW